MIEEKKPFVSPFYDKKITKYNFVKYIWKHGHSVHIHLEK